jgi:hypothetical protein
MCDRVPTGREVIVSSALILIRASLIAPTRGLVVIRPRLILITRHLVAISRPLQTVPISQRITILRSAITKLGSPIARRRHPVTIARCLIADRISRTGRRFGVRGRSRQMPGQLAAGWAPRNLGHRGHPSPSPAPFLEQKALGDHLQHEQSVVAVGTSPLQGHSVGVHQGVSRKARRGFLRQAKWLSARCWRGTTCALCRASESCVTSAWSRTRSI